MPRRNRTEEAERKHNRHCVFRDSLKAGAERRASARGQAIIAADRILDATPDMPFVELLARIRRRWPVSCAGERFAADLKRLHDLPQAERERQWWRIAEQAEKAPQIDCDASQPMKGQTAAPNDRTRQTRSWTAC